MLWARFLVAVGVDISNRSTERAGRSIIGYELHTFMYSSVASCHSLVIVRGRTGLANRRVMEKRAMAPAITDAERKKTLRPSSGGGGRRGPWGPKAM